MDLCKRVASDWKNPVAQYLIGCMYFEGEGVPEDKTSGVHWFSVAAESGWPYAMVRMGMIYTQDASMKADHKKAIIWFDKVAKNDDNETELIKDETFYLFGNTNFEVDFTHVNQEIMKTMYAGFTQGSVVSPRICDIYKDLIPHYEDYRRIHTWNLLTKKKIKWSGGKSIGTSRNLLNRR